MRFNSSFKRMVKIAMLNTRVFIALKDFFFIFKLFLLIPHNLFLIAFVPSLLGSIGCIHKGRLLPIDDIHYKGQLV